MVKVLVCHTDGFMYGIIDVAHRFATSGKEYPVVSEQEICDGEHIEYSIIDDQDGIHYFSTRESESFDRKGTVSVFTWFHVEEREG